MSDYRELIERVTVYRQRVDRRLTQALRDCGKEATADMRSNVPVDTGNLKRSIRYRVVRTAEGPQLRIYANATSFNSKGGGTVKYAEFVEYGTGVYNQHGDGRQTPWIVNAVVHGVERTWTTRGNVAQPFIRPAMAKFRARFRRMRPYVLEEG
jgi:HK97 gp10 family phage protein